MGVAEGGEAKMMVEVKRREDAGTKGKSDGVYEDVDGIEQGWTRRPTEPPQITPGLPALFFRDILVQDIRRPEAVHDASSLVDAHRR